MRRFVLGVVLLAVARGTTFAQPAPEPLFATVNPTLATAAIVAAQPSNNAVVDREMVSMRLDRLFGDANAQVLLNVGGHAWVARIEHLAARDVLGHRSWVGAIDGVEHSHVSFTERDGVVSGLINALSETYEVRTVSPGLYALEQVDTSRLRGEAEPRHDSASAASAAPSTAGNPSAVGDDPGTFDVLLLYTPAAQARQGGAAQMQALASRIISDSNTAFTRSGITPRLRLVGTVPFAYVEATAMSVDLNAVTSSATARSLRDQYGADLVQLLVDSPDQTSCGIAWLLSSLSSTNFNAYSVADVACASQYTPTHELGHSMGSHHAPEDSASGALFPYSYGFKDPVRGFRTIMAYACSGPSCPRVLNFSNPSVLQNGGATGTSTQNNALSINNAAQTVANFRQATTTPPPPPTAMTPSAPTGLKSQVNGTTVTLSWNAVSSPFAATSYVLHVGSAPGASNLFFSSVGNVTSVTGSAPVGIYYWRVVAANSAGSGPASAEATFAIGECLVPGPPQNLNFTLTGATVTLTWTPPAYGGAPTTYVIEVGSASMLANLFNGPTGSIATAISAQAPPGAYFVRIRARNTCGTSAPSVERTIVVP